MEQALTPPVAAKPPPLKATDLVIHVSRFMGQTLAPTQTQAGLPMQASLVQLHGQTSLAMGVERLLQGVPGLELEQRNEILRSHWHGLPLDAPTTWWYCNHSSKLRVSHNDVPIQPGQVIQLQKNDQLELGWLILHIHSALDWEVASASVQTEPVLAPTPIQHGVAPAAPAPKTFELTDLAPPHVQHTSGFIPREVAGRNHHSDIGNLFKDALQDQIRADSSRPETTASPSNPSPIDKIAPTAVVHPIWLQQPDTTKHQQTQDDPLQPLHEQYLAFLHNPFFSPEQDQWSQMIEGTSKSEQDPLEQLKAAAGNIGGLLDLMGAEPNMMQIMAQLDSLNQQNLFAPEQIDSVVQLFAPNKSQPAPPQDRSILQVFAQTESLGLPRLTRREHHSMSLDSAMSASDQPPQSAQTEQSQAPSLATLFGLHDALAPQPPAPP